MATTISRIDSDQTIIFNGDLEVLDDVVLTDASLLVNGNLKLSGKKSRFIINKGNLQVTGNVHSESAEPITVMDGNISIGGNLVCERIINNRTISIDGNSLVSSYFCTYLLVRGYKKTNHIHQIGYSVNRHIKAG